jgi:hypothetical protein
MICEGLAVMWKEAVVAYFKVCSVRYLRMTEESYRNFSKA